MHHPWQDTALPARIRAAALLSQMTLEEKLAQLVGIWPGSDNSAADEDVAPMQHELNSVQQDPQSLLPHGLGHLTRPFGTAPVDPTEGARTLADDQRRIAQANRFGIPAIAHEECLTGFAAWQAAIFPTET